MASVKKITTHDVIFENVFQNFGVKYKTHFCNTIDFISKYVDIIDCLFWCYYNHRVWEWYDISIKYFRQVRTYRTAVCVCLLFVWIFINWYFIANDNFYFYYIEEFKLMVLVGGLSIKMLGMMSFLECLSKFGANLKHFCNTIIDFIIRL